MELKRRILLKVHCDSVIFLSVGVASEGILMVFSALLVGSRSEVAYPSFVVRVKS
jgi:hypothetical protein